MPEDPKFADQWFGHLPSTDQLRRETTNIYDTIGGMTSFDADFGGFSEVSDWDMSNVNFDFGEF